ncbi:DUF3142 domain-containing protein [Pontiella sp.]|uniref:DUF3142 domain-containing protein n=1 Tax=Pontiella sp. TaxID=2837462 RepID=UPI00356154E1
MKPCAAIFALTLLVSTGLADGFYVWQQQWSSNVVAAVVSEPATTLYPLATVVPASGPSQPIAVPWDTLRATDHRVVPVVRVPLKAFGRNDLLDELVRLARELDDFDEIQLDLDCPESRLGEYAALTAAFRQQVPDKKLSITALPSHLGNLAFRRLAQTTDYYVLQLHGLDVPGHIGDRTELMNWRTAERAVERAETMGHPYRIALPCYAYELNFDPDSGTFLFLTAERPARRKPTVKKRSCAQPADLLRLRNTDREIIWFRLPVEGDRLCWPRETLAEIQAGRVPENEIGLGVKPISGETLELILQNGNVIHTHAVELALRWAEPRGAYDLYDGVAESDRIPGRLPAALSIDLPPPGQSKTIGWFATPQPPTTTLKLK